jgi:hypothetical protein
VGAPNRKELEMSFQKSLVIAAMALGVGAGSYGIASAAGGGSSNGSSTTAAPAQSAPSTPWGGQRSDETPLTGDALAKVTAVAESKVAGGTVVRVETDADGHARYEAHMTDASGNPVTVYVNENFEYVSTERRP